MRIDFAKNGMPVEEGPPEPPAPTMVRFDRKVVALFGHPGLLPDQLNCDTLRLTLVPTAKPPQPKPARTDENEPGAPAVGVAAVSSDPAVKAPATPAPEGVARSETRDEADRAASPARSGAVARSGASGDVNPVKPGAGKDADSDSAPSAGASQGPFGNLTLQRAHATGHAVWLQLREQGAKVRCNELIYERRAPDHQPDMTYFRGDVTRPMWLEKIDREPVELADQKTQIVDGNGSTRSDQLAQAGRPRQGKITGVTHVLTLDATIFDKGEGLDLADIVAHGPGSLESRPDLQEPVERIAVWQDQLTINNEIGPESQLVQKEVVLTGTRPYFVDTVKKTSLDSAESIYVWLKPKASVTKKTTGSPAAPTSTLMASTNGASADGVKSAGQETTGGGLGGGGLEVERLRAFRDVHALVPDKKMEGRKVMDLQFVEAEPTPVVASTTSAPSADGAGRGAGAGSGPGERAGTSSKVRSPRRGQPAQKPPAEPTMTGVADHIWANVARKPGSGLDSIEPESHAGGGQADGHERQHRGGRRRQAPPPLSPRRSGDSDTDIREAWLRGNVALHQDSPPDKPENPDGTKAKPKSQDITGEAVYLDNHKGKGKMLAWVFYRDPNQPPRPGPLPWAKVANDDMTIRSEQAHPAGPGARQGLG